MEANDPTPIMPTLAERLPLAIIEAPHPTLYELDELLKKCEFRNQARGGPGGQHRNRTASGVFVTFLPAEITAEATEQRNQQRNREIAIRRLRYLLAVSLRTASPLSVLADERTREQPCDAEQTVRDRYHASPLKLADDNVQKPAVLALLLNDLHVAGGQPSLVGSVWGVSTSKIVALVRSQPAAWTLLNRIRAHHGRSPLK